MNVPQWIVLLVVIALVLRHWGLERRMGRLESALDGLSRHVGALPPLVTAPSQRVKDLAMMPGKKVEAVRALREETGLGLKEAVRIVDALKAETGRCRR